MLKVSLRAKFADVTFFDKATRTRMRTEVPDTRKENPVKYIRFYSSIFA